MVFSNKIQIKFDFWKIFHQQISTNYKILTSTIFQTTTIIFHFRERDNVFWLHYEDLLKDLRRCITELARFLDVRLSDDQIDAVYEMCTYEYMRENADKFSGQFLINLRSGMLAVEPWRPLVGRISQSRSDGAQSGHGSLNLNEKTKATIRWNWRHSVEKLTGYRSYSSLYASNGVARRSQKNETSDSPKRKNTLNLLWVVDFFEETEFFLCFMGNALDFLLFEFFCVLWTIEVLFFVFSGQYVRIFLFFFARLFSFFAFALDFLFWVSWDWNFF